MQQTMSQAVGQTVDLTKSLGQVIRKYLCLREARGVACRVFPPNTIQPSYVVILEKERATERLSINLHHVQQSLGGGLDPAVTTEVRSALQSLDKAARRRDPRKRFL